VRVGSRRYGLGVLLSVAGPASDARAWWRTAGRQAAAAIRFTEIFHASLTEVEACHLAQRWSRRSFRKAFRDRQKELAQVRTAGCQLIHWEESEYRKRLLEIYAPLPLLYVRRNEQVLNCHAISIVRARRPTPYGNQIAERLVRPGQPRA